MTSTRKDAQARLGERLRHPSELVPKDTYGRAAAADQEIPSPPRQVSPSTPDYDSRGGRTPGPRSGDIASTEGSDTGGAWYVPYPPYDRQFAYPWPFGSPQAGGFVPALQGASPPQFGYYYPNYPPPYFSYAIPYRYP